MSPTALAAQNGNSKPIYKIASIPGDGIGPEVIAAGIQVLTTLSNTLGTFSLEFTHFPWSSAYYKEHGKYLPDDYLEVLRGFDAILFGAVGDPGSSFLSPFSLLSYRNLFEGLY
jgi:isocitrate/isopropylmalate dehydrogenase